MMDVHHVYSGKVRELYELPDGRLLFVATDRISAYDHVLPTEIPDKGAILTQLSLWWFERLADIVPHHVLSTDVPAEFAGRALVCERLDMVPVECVARGYLAGSGLAEYAGSRSVCGIAFPKGSKRFASSDDIFTPATKGPQGEHDENVSFRAVEYSLGAYLAHELRRLTLAVYARGHAIAMERGIVLADTKLEFGRRADGTIVLADEVLTPDSSRFWPATRGRPAARSRRTTSSTSATGSPRPKPAGTALGGAAALRCPTRWSSRPGAGTSRRTNA
jgi:phosphoribosylaminoimidazole-succinocarboxamide synthase